MFFDVPRAPYKDMQPALRVMGLQFAPLTEVRVLELRAGQPDTAFYNLRQDCLFPKPVVKKYTPKGGNKTAT